jgi:HEAT repeat protein
LTHRCKKSAGCVFAIVPHFIIQSELRVFALPGIRPPMPRLDPVATIAALYDAERAARDAHDELAHDEPARVLPAIEHACREALALEDEEELSLRLKCLAELLGELEGPRVVDLLIDILGCEDPEARRMAGESLSGLAFDRFKEVALGVERALGRLPEGNPALSELPYLLAEIPEPGVTKLLAQFLVHRDADAVASAIEALVEVGDPSVLPLLEPLAGDSRRVELEDEGGTEGNASIGELVSEARSLLRRGASS